MGRFGLLGEKLAHSFSPLIHAELGNYAYELYEKNPEEVENFLRHGEFDGLNVTIPYKKTVVPFCSELSEAARASGSVNTLIRQKDGTFYGDNTDFYGFAYALQKAGIDPAAKKVLILGSGGSAYMARAVLEAMCAKEIIITPRTETDNYEIVDRHRDAVIIINTTPVGMYPNNGVSPIRDLGIFPHCQAVVDIIFNPARTALMQQAETHGISCANGLGLTMLVAQAKRASELFTGTSVPDEKIEPIVEKITNITRNIILIGMPGCGKTSIGKALAAKTERKFADSDDLIVQTSGKPIPDIFEQDGEDVFRKFETDALKALCKQSGLVIATGGGIVMRPENKNIIRQNGVIVYLDRDIAELPVTDRPVSIRDGISALAAVRQPLYRQWSDYTLPVSDVEQTAEDICRLVYN